MGGDVLLALNIAAFPSDLPAEILSAIFEGGASKMAEAGGIIAGGHTVTDPEPKYGLCVTGSIHPDQILTKAGAKAGDRLFLTKPLGTGAITTAMKNGSAAPEHASAAIESMQTLNRSASEAVRRVGVHACTDITGFGLLGHASEVAAKSGVHLRIGAAAVPLLPGAMESAAAGHLPGGMKRNRTHFSAETGGGVTVASTVGADLDALLYDPETSGGLFLTVPNERSAALRAAFAAVDLPLWEIGDVAPGAGILVE